MSLVPVYVRAVDGFFYKEPVLKGGGWFICFDDQEDPELVMKADYNKTMGASRLLREMGFGGRRTGRGPSGLRSFEGGDYPANSYFFRLSGPIPVPSEHQGKVDTPEGQCVIYDPK